MYQKLLNIHIGNKIKQVTETNGISATELGKRINRNRTNVYDIFKRNAVDTQLLILISQALDYNIFELFITNEEIKKPNTRFSFEIEITPDELESFCFPDSICEHCSIKEKSCRN